jgi:single-strand DNA-binding protein
MNTTMQTTPISNAPIASLNRVSLIGNIGNDIEIVKTSNGQYCRISVATSETYISAGTPKEVTTWHRITLWDKNADFAVKNLKKGSKVHIEGKMVSRTYEDKDKKTVYVYEVNCNLIELYLNGN